MKVLILHQHFNMPQQGGPLRSYYLATALAGQGIEPIVFTTHNQATETVVRSEGVEVHYLAIPYDNSFGFWKRGMAFLAFAWKVFRRVARLKDVSICYAISVPLTVGLAAWGIKRRYKIPYIFEVGDLWPEAPIQLGFVSNRFLKFALYKLERMVYQGAESIVALSPMIQSGIAAKVPAKKIDLIPNMADTAYYSPTKKDPVLENTFGVTRKFVISYIGAVGLANGLEFLIASAHACQQSSLPVHFLICGTGAKLESLQNTAERLQLKNLSFLSFRNRAGVKDVMNITDATFICYKPVQILETGSPNKYFDGLASGKLVMINFEGWIKDEIEEQEIGVYIDRRNPNDIVRKILSFLENPDRLEQYKGRSRKLAEDNYSRTMLSKRFVSLFDQYSTQAGRAPVASSEGQT